MSYAHTHFTGETSSSPDPNDDTFNPYGTPKEAAEPLYAGPSLPPPPPPVPISRHVTQFRRLLWASLALSVAALVASLVVCLGALSLWITPTAFLLTTIFNIVLIVLLRKERGKPVGKGRSVVAALGTMACAWILAFLWVGCSAVVLMESIPSNINDHEVYVEGYVEAAFDVAQVGVVAAMAVRSFMERRVSARADRDGGLQVEAFPPQQQYTGQSQVQQQAPPQILQEQFPANVQLQYLPQIQQQDTVLQQHPMQQQQYPIQMNQIPMQQAPPDAMQVHPAYPWGRAMV